MKPWLETGGVLTLAMLGVGLGWWFARRTKSYWWPGYVIPLLLICLIGLARRYSRLEFTPPVSWLMKGRTEFALGALIGTMVLTTPLLKLPRKRDRILVGVLMGLILWQTVLWPFLAPAFNQARLSRLITKIDSDGVCLQSTEYNCGPAAAVTALRKLGLAAEEGQLAILAHTSEAMGTPPDILADTLQARYAAQGLHCEYRHFNSLAELRNAGLTLALVKFSLLLDHYVTVLEVTNDAVWVGDPLFGKTKLSSAEFLAKWRYCGVVLQRAR